MENGAITRNPNETPKRNRPVQNEHQAAHSPLFGFEQSRSDEFPEFPENDRESTDYTQPERHINLLHEQFAQFSGDYFEHGRFETHLIAQSHRIGSPANGPVRREIRVARSKNPPFKNPVDIPESSHRYHHDSHYRPQDVFAQFIDMVEKTHLAPFPLVAFIFV